MKRPLRIGVVFFVASAIWIFVSDVAVVTLAGNLEAMRVAQTLKGWLYVAFASLLVVYLARRELEASRREAESLRRSEDRYRHLFDRAPLPLWIFDQETLEFLEVNEAAVEKYGYTREEFLAMTIADIRPPDHRTRLLESVGSEEGLHRAGVWTHLARDGTEIDVEIAAFPVRFRGRPAEFVMATDVATRAMAHEALRQGRRTYEQLFQKSHAIMLIVDPDDGSIVDANRAAAGFYGYSVERLCGMRVSDLNPADPRTLDHHLEESSRSRARFLQVRHRVADGSERDVEVYAAPVELGDQKVVLAIVHDVSDRAEMRRQLEHAQRMETLGRLAGGVAHDFNNLLTVIRNTAELVEEELGTGGDAGKDLRVIVDATERGANLTRQLLAFSRKQVSRPEVVEINTGLNRMSGMLERLLGDRMRIDWDVTDRPTHAWVDRGQIEQVVLNLVLNARDAMPEGGTLRLSTRVEPGEGEGDQVVLAVEDDGPGVPSDLRQSIFEPFFTTKPEGEGTGLGLSTVFGIVRQAHGSVTLDPEYSDGARFLVRLPLVPTPLESAESKSDPASGMDRDILPSPDLEPVLLVEDDPAVRRVAERILTRAGYDAVSVPSAEEALDLIRSRGTESVSLVVSDVVMPGMNGPEMLGEMRRLGVTAPAILTSGHRPRAPDDLERERLDPIRYLDKPFSAEELVGAVERMVLDSGRGV
ncbi:MAG TPA: PAS domain S-box protein [Longimicrobiales bacterium]|nr:PAS domain S-box protein [Longimicrobiales bacterium]